MNPINKSYSNLSNNYVGLKNKPQVPETVQAPKPSMNSTDTVAFKGAINAQAGKEVAKNAVPFLATAGAAILGFLGVSKYKKEEPVAPPKKTLHELMQEREEEAKKKLAELKAQYEAENEAYREGLKNGTIEIPDNIQIDYDAARKAEKEQNNSTLPEGLKKDLKDLKAQLEAKSELAKKGNYMDAWLNGEITDNEYIEIEKATIAAQIEKEVNEEANGDQNIKDYLNGDISAEDFIKRANQKAAIIKNSAGTHATDYPFYSDYNYYYSNMCNKNYYTYENKKQGFLRNLMEETLYLNDIESKAVKKKNDYMEQLAHIESSLRSWANIKDCEAYNKGIKRPMIVNNQYGTLIRKDHTSIYMDKHGAVIKAVIYDYIGEYGRDMEKYNVTTIEYDSKGNELHRSVHGRIF